MMADGISFILYHDWQTSWAKGSVPVLDHDTKQNSLSVLYYYSEHLLKPQLMRF